MIAVQGSFGQSKWGLVVDGVRETPGSMVDAKILAAVLLGDY
jgi:hypothetical protein